VSYSFAVERSGIFTEEGQVAFLKIRDNAHRLIKQSGAATMGKLMIGSGSSWTLMACVHRLVELGELVSIWDKGAGQDEVFIGGPKFHV
jgi:hypothetical protein